MNINRPVKAGCGRERVGSKVGRHILCRGEKRFSTGSHGARVGKLPGSGPSMNNSTHGQGRVIRPQLTTSEGHRVSGNNAVIREISVRQ